MERSKTISRRALGRGLSNLIPVFDNNKEEANEIHNIDSNAIITNPFQPRKEFNDEEISGLAESIKSQGLLQPVLVRKTPGGYQIISGERRFRALKFLGNDKIPCIIKSKASDREMLEMALVENVQREDLNEIEKATAYKKLLTECGLSHESLAKRIGKGRAAVTNTLRLLKLPGKIQDMIRGGVISMGHARALLSIEDDVKKVEISEQIIKKNLSVRDVEALAHSQKGRSRTKGAVKKGRKDFLNDPDVVGCIEKLQYRFGTDINIFSNAKEKGAIQISFYSREDLNRILNILLE